MGLDTFAGYPRNHPKYEGEGGETFSLIPSELFPENNLCGGLFSGGGNSFRGKVYNEMIEDITNISLYNEVIPLRYVKDMVSRIERHISIHKNTDPELLYLLGWFQVVVKEEAAIYGWW